MIPARSHSVHFRLKNLSSVALAVCAMLGRTATSHRPRTTRRSRYPQVPVAAGAGEVRFRRRVPKQVPAAAALIWPSSLTSTWQLPLKRRLVLE